MSDFHWHIEDDPTTHQPPRDARPPALTHRAWLPALGALALVAALAAGGVWLWLDHQAQAQEAEIVRLARLEDRLLEQGDDEALATLYDADYRALHAALAPRPLDGTLVVTWSIGLPISYTLGPARYGAVRLDGERAELDVTRAYTAQSGAPVTFDVRETRFYRLSDGAWLRTLPPETAWQDVRQVSDDTLDLTYPTRDAAVIEPLVPRLQALAERICADVGCARRRAQLVLSGDLAALARTSNVKPAPLLLDTPEGPAGEAVLYRTYGVALVSLMLRNASIVNRTSGVAVRWEAVRVGVANPPDASALQRAARYALSGGAAGLWDSSEHADALGWLAFSYLDSPHGPRALVQMLNSVYGDAVWLYTQTERDPGWWDYLEQVAALEPQYAGDAQLAMLCDTVQLWKASTSARRPLALSGAGLRWSPHGEQLAALTNSNHVLVTLAPAGPLAPGRENLIWVPGFLLAWSPDGTRLLTQTDAGRVIWRIGADAAVSQTNIASLGWGDWSPDGTRLAYGHGRALYLSGPDGEQPQRIATVTLGAWAPDGHTLAVVDNSGVHPPVSLYDLASGALTTVLTRTPGIVYQLAWSPDGTRLAVAGRSVESGDDTPALTVVDRQGHVVRVWEFGSAVWSVQWSPDGRELGWMMVGDPNGDELTITTVSGNARESYPIKTSDDPAAWGWSPDGYWLAYDAPGGITVRARDGSSTRHIDGCHAPAWRPQGHTGGRGARRP
jgi:hypothetical protein